MELNHERRGAIDVITINRPDALNALNFQLVRDLARLLDTVEDGPVRGLIITGTGDKAFCAGADIAELAGRTILEHKRDMERGQRVFDRLSRFIVPTLAVINGYALGGGLELAMACNLRVATGNARLGLPEIRLGAIPGYGGTQRLPRLIGEGRAMDMILTGRAIDAEEAERIGLVNRIVGGDGRDPVDAGIDYLSEITRFGLPAIRLAREAVQRAHDLPVSEALRAEADLNTLAFQTEDLVEGTAAFLEKRKPVFRDR